MAVLARFLSFLLALLLSAPIAVSAASLGAPARPDAPAADRVLPAEFERQEALLLAWEGGNLPVQRALTEIIAATWHTTTVIVLVHGDDEEFEAVDVLRRAGVPRRGLSFVSLPHDSFWTRDYGPVVVRRGDGGFEIVDMNYQRGERPNDDELPSLIGLELATPAVRAPLEMEGGNLISNGAGLCLTTTKLLSQNADRGYGEAEVRRLLQQFYGASDVVFLEPLVGEPTGHVDMFATFTAADTVVVGQISPDEDAANAALLDRNAERLAEVRTPRGPLNVVRIPMPACSGSSWRTYTNVLFANDVLLVPHYSDADQTEAAKARAVYQRMLPEWRIVSVECSELIGLGGALHCVSRNLPRIGRFPARRQEEAETASGVEPPHAGAQPEDGTELQPGAEVIESPGLIEAIEDGWEPVDPEGDAPVLPAEQPLGLFPDVAGSYDPHRVPFERD